MGPRCSSLVQLPCGVSSADQFAYFGVLGSTAMHCWVVSPADRCVMVSSADLFRNSLYSHCVMSVKSEGDSGEGGDAEGSVGAVIHNGQRYKQICLVNAFRDVGLEVPYTGDGPFWAKYYGNRMLAPHDLEVIEVEQEALGREGLFVLHRDYHFIGCTVVGNAVYMHDRCDGHPSTQLVQLADRVVFHGDIRVFQLFALATGSPADPRIATRMPTPTRLRVTHGRFMPAASVEDLMRRVRHRQAGVDAVKRAEDNYYQMVNVCVARGLLDARSKPSTPDPYDATLSKRTSEEGMKSWRHKLRCALEKAMAPESREDDIVGGVGCDGFSGLSDVVTESSQCLFRPKNFGNGAAELPLGHFCDPCIEADADRMV